MIDRITAAALAAALACACASSAPPDEPRAECPEPGPRETPALGFAIAGDPQRGEFLFGRVCARCHANDVAQREPDAPANAPRLDCAPWLAATSDAYLYDAINRGPGASGHGGLPPLGERLAPQQIADLVAYLRRSAIAPQPPNPAGSAPTTRR
jgi:mono/diheme cytochrome c family protein